MRRSKTLSMPTYDYHDHRIEQMHDYVDSQVVDAIESGAISWKQDVDNECHIVFLNDKPIGYFDSCYIDESSTPLELAAEVLRKDLLEDAQEWL